MVVPDSGGVVQDEHDVGSRKKAVEVEVEVEDPTFLIDTVEVAVVVGT